MALLRLTETAPSWGLLAVIATLLLFTYQLINSLVTSARHRRFKRDNGCEDPFHYQHKGFWGKLLGVDVILELVRTGQQGRTLEAARLRNYAAGHNTVEIRILNRKDYILVAASTDQILVLATIEPENIQTMLSVKFADWALGERRRQVFEPIFGPGIFTRDGEDWKHSRALIRPNFTKMRASDFDMFETHFNHLHKLLIENGERPIDIQEFFFRLTMDASTELMFGTSTNTLVPELETQTAREFVKGFAYTTSTVSVALQSGRITDFIPNKKYRDSIRAMHKFADEIVQKNLAMTYAEKQAENKKSYTFLQELMKLTQDHASIRSELLNLLMAGRDTTAGLLGITFYIFARRPEVWKKVKAEVSDILGDQLPNENHIRDLKYLRAVLNEVMRLYPPVPMNSRMAVRDTILPVGGGPNARSPVFVPKGTVVTYATYSMHRRKDLFGEDAMEFKPDRWITGSLKHKPGWEYLPFNGGPRVCIGQEFAMNMVSYITARLVQEYSRVECHDDSEWKEFLTLSLSSGNGCWVSMHK